MDILKHSRKGNRIRGTFGLLWRVLIPAILFGFAITFLDKAGEGIFSFADSPWDFLWLAFLTLFLLGLYLYFIFDRIQRQISATATSFDAAEIDATEKTERPYMICGYSPITNKNVQILDLDLGSFGNSIETACDNAHFLQFGSWQQNLRVLCKIKCVRHLYVIDPSIDQFERFKKVVNHFFPETGITRVTGSDGSTTLKRHHHDSIAPDYENFEYVTLAIERALHMIAEDEGKRLKKKVKIEEIENRVAIDVTGGFKTFSIAAAIMSLNRDLVFVYAVTAPERLGQVIAYDAKIQLFEQVF